MFWDKATHNFHIHSLDIPILDTSDDYVINFLNLHSAVVDLLDTNIEVSNKCSDFNVNSIRLSTDGEKKKVDTKPKGDEIKLDSFEPNVVQCLDLNERILQDGIISLDTIREAQLLDGFIQGILKTLDKNENYFLRKGILLHRRSNEERIVFFSTLLPFLTVW